MKKLLINMLLILVGNLLVAFSVVGFIIPNDILSGGVAGIAVGLQPIFPWLDKAIFISFANIVLFLLGAVFLGKEFARGTVLSTIFYTIELNLLNVVCRIKPLRELQREPLQLTRHRFLCQSYPEARKQSCKEKT